MSRRHRHPDEPLMLVTNGFTRETHPFQIISYVVFFGDLLIFYLFLVPLLTDVGKIIACITMFISAVATIVSAYISTKTDPSDPQVKAHRRAVSEGRTYDSEGESHCKVCDLNVHASSRHCKRCDRCVEGFDHHCKWVNNCIGKANYKPFLVMIISAFSFTAIYIVFAIIAAVNVWTNTDDHFLDHTYSNNLSVKIGLITVVLIFSLPTFLMMILDFNLIALHLHLMRLKMTTYDYIEFVQGRKEVKSLMKAVAREEKLKKQEELLSGRSGRLSPERTCFDFVLCLKKRRKTGQQGGLTAQNTNIEGRDMLGDVISSPASKKVLSMEETEKQVKIELGDTNEKRQEQQHLAGEVYTKPLDLVEDQRPEMKVHEDEAVHDAHWNERKGAVTKHLDNIVPIKVHNSNQKNEERLIEQHKSSSAKISNTDPFETEGLAENAKKADYLTLDMPREQSKTPQPLRRKLQPLDGGYDIALSMDDGFHSAKSERYQVHHHGDSPIAEDREHKY